MGAVFAAPRDCASAQDNDCDGRPDNIVDNVCTCTIGEVRACGTHPQDGIGQCRAGQQRCEAGPGNSSSSFGACTGSVGAAPQDSCANVNDANCNGVPNDACDCLTSRGNADCSDDPRNSRCNASGRCVPCQSTADCSFIPGTVCQSQGCVTLLGAGEVCTQDDQCQSRSCLRWFLDRDGDGFGAEELGACAGNGGNPVPPDVNYVARGGDCCDLGGLGRATAAQIHPEQDLLFVIAQTVCPSVDEFDYNCSLDIEYEFQEDTEAAAGGCRFEGCEGASVWALSQMGGQVPACGTTGLLVGCAGSSPDCTGRPVGQVVNRCH